MSNPELDRKNIANAHSGRFGNTSVFQNRGAPSVQEASESLLPDSMKTQRSALVTLEDGSNQLGTYIVTRLGLKSGGLNEAEWLEFGRLLKQFDGSLQWIIGDWLVEGELKWGKKYEQACALTNLAYDTVKDYAYVCRNVQLSVRTDNLEFGHHKLIASMEPELQKQWLDYAIQERMSVARMRLAINPDGGAGDTEARQTRKRISKIIAARAKVPNMKPEKRQAFASEARALSEYFADLARWAEGEEQ